MNNINHLCNQINRNAATNVSMTGKLLTSGFFIGYIRASTIDELHEFIRYIAVTREREFVGLEFRYGTHNPPTFTCHLEFDTSEVKDKNTYMISLCNSCGIRVESDYSYVGGCITCPKCNNTIVVGFIDKNESPPPPSEPIINQPQSLPIDISLVHFYSTDHIRYNNGIREATDNSNCRRLLEIKTDKEYDQSFFVTIYNLSGIHPEWGDNIQIAPKRMKAISSTKDSITLHGHGSDPMLTNRSPQLQENNGITIHLIDNNIHYISWYIYDRNVRIDYLN